MFTRSVARVRTSRTVCSNAYKGYGLVRPRPISEWRTKDTPALPARRPARARGHALRIHAAGKEEDDGARLEAAVEECRQLLEQATQMAQVETVVELEDQFVDESPSTSAAPDVSCYPTLSLGAGRGAGGDAEAMAVRALHLALAAPFLAPLVAEAGGAGYAAERAGNMFGPHTEAVVRAFRGLHCPAPPDACGPPSPSGGGEVDAETWEVLLREGRVRVLAGALRDAALLPDAAPASRGGERWSAVGMSRELLQQRERRAGHGGSGENLDRLVSRLRRLKRLLPGVDVVRLAGADPEVLDADFRVSARNVMLLMTGLAPLPASALWDMVLACPRVLYTPSQDLQRRIEAALSKIRSWSPNSTATEVVAEEPTIMLMRVPDYYMEAIFSDLPLDIQNCMVVGGGGGGQLWRSWSGFVDNNTD